MLLKCPNCETECTIDEDASLVTCPSCGCDLSSLPVGLPASANDADWEPTATKLQSPPREFAAFELSLPHRAGKYLIESLIARGGFAQVYLAKDTELDRSVALKIPRTEQIADSEKLAAILNEAKTAARLRHPGIVTIYEIGYLPEGTPFIAMEYLPGKSLRELLKHERIPFHLAADLVASMAEAVHYAHQQGLVHRDLKPANVLVDERGHPKVCDFGLALHESKQARMSGDVAGTPAYMAPEQIRGESHRLDGRTDVWSLGVMLYEMTTGRRPFGADVRQLFDEIQNRDPKPPRQINDRIPKEIEDICQRCLAKSLGARFSTALDVADALRSWLRNAEHPSSSFSLSVGDTESQRLATLASAGTVDSGGSFVAQSRLSRNWLLLGGLLVLGLVVGISALAMGPWNAPEVEPSWRPPASIVVRDEFKGKKLDLNRPYPLLERSPEVLVWSRLAADANWSYERKRQDLFISSSHPSAIEFGNFDWSDFVLEIRIAKSAWLGSSGVFWGLHDGVTEDGTPSMRCQAIFLHSYLDEGKVEHRLDRDLLEFWTPPGSPSPAMGRYQFLSEKVPAPNNPEMRLELRIMADQLHSVTWNGFLINGLKDTPIVKPPRPLVSRGRLGVFNEGGAVTFRDARIQLLRFPFPSP